MLYQVLVGDEEVGLFISSISIIVDNMAKRPDNSSMDQGRKTGQGRRGDGTGRNRKNAGRA